MLPAGLSQTGRRLSIEPQMRRHCPTLRHTRPKHARGQPPTLLQLLDLPGQTLFGDATFDPFTGQRQTQWRHRPPRDLGFGVDTFKQPRRAGDKAQAQAGRDAPGQAADQQAALGKREKNAEMRAYHEDTHNLAEGAGAAALAALMQERELNAGQRVAVVLSGANIDRAALAELLRDEAPVAA